LYTYIANVQRPYYSISITGWQLHQSITRKYY